MSLFITLLRMHSFNTNLSQRVQVDPDQLPVPKTELGELRRGWEHMMGMTLEESSLASAWESKDREREGNDLGGGRRWVEGHHPLAEVREDVALSYAPKTQPRSILAG